MKWILLDFGTYQLKALEVSFEGGEIELHRFVHFPSRPEYFKGLAQPDSKAWVAMTTHLHEAEWLPYEEETIFLTALPSSYLEARYLPFPFKSQKKIEKVISMELEPLIPFDLEDIQIRNLFLSGPSVSPKKKQALVLTLSCKRELIKHYEDELKKFQPSHPALTPQILALSSLRQGIEIPIFYLLEIGHSKSQLLLLQKSGDILGLRTFWWGGAHLLKALTQDLKGNVKQADEFLTKNEFFEKAQLKKFTMLNQCVQEFFSDFKRTLKFWQASGLIISNEFPICILSRLMSSFFFQKTFQENLPQDLKSSIVSFPLDAFKSWAPLTGWEKIETPEAALPAISLALMQVQPHRSKIPTFSETSFVFQQSLKKIKTGSFTLLKKAAVLLIAPTLFLLLGLWFHGKENQRIAGGLSKILKSAGIEAPRRYSPEQLLKDIQKQIVINRQKIVQLQEDEDSPLSILTKLSKLIPPYLKIDVKELKITVGRILVVAETDSDDSVQQIIKTVRTHFPEIKLGATQLCNNGGKCVSFSFEILRTKT